MQQLIIKHQKLKEKKLVSLGRKNINNQKANIRVDLDNNKKANAVFNMFTDNTPIASGPKRTRQSYKPRVSGNPGTK